MNHKSERRPTALRAIIRNFGDAQEVVKIEPCEIEPLGPGQVRVRMLLAAINPSDLVSISGAYAHRTELPFVGGFEGVGVVEETAPGVDSLKPGMRVLPIGSSGAWQSHRIVAAKWCFPVAEALDDRQATLAYVNPMTAWLIMHERAELQAARRIVISAAGSAIGRMLVRLANRAGIRPAAIVRSHAGAGLLDGLDVARIIVSSGGDCAHSIREIWPDGADLALDAVGGAVAGGMYKALSETGRMIHYGLLSGESARIDAGRKGAPEFELFVLRRWVHAASRARLEACFAEIFSAIAAGWLGSEVEAVYPLPQMAQALAHNARRGRRGKILVSLRQEDW